MDEQNFGHKSFVFWRERSFKTATLGFDTISIIWPRWNLYFRAKNKHYLHMTAKEVIFIHFSHHFQAKAFKIWGVISLLNSLQLAFIFYCVAKQKQEQKVISCHYLSQILSFVLWRKNLQVKSSISNKELHSLLLPNLLLYGTYLVHTLPPPSINEKVAKLCKKLIDVLLRT